MTNERFKELLEELDGNSVKTLAEKNARYSADSGDALHNFKEGAEILGGTPAQACWGYMTKHLVALRDKVEKNDFSDKEDFLEKCQDTINYIRFLWCIGNEEEKNDKTNIDRSPTINIYSRSDDSLFAQFEPCHHAEIIAEDAYKFRIATVIETVNGIRMCNYEYVKSDYYYIIKY